MSNYFNIAVDDNITKEQISELMPDWIISEETYNGWSNRETWALSLHLTNTEALYKDLMQIINEKNKKDYQKADYLKNWVEDMVYNFMEDNEMLYKNEIKMLIQDVGSLWRVNWKEVITSNSEK